MVIITNHRLAITNNRLTTTSHRLATSNGLATQPQIKMAKMKRELYALLSNDSKDCPPIIQTNAIPGGYKQKKVKLGQRKVRSWKWVRFNPGRTDSFYLYHWRRAAEEHKEYPFAKFNKKIPIPQYTFQEYQQKIQCDDWNKEESDYLLSLCKQFDLRFPVIHDRWDRTKFKNRTMEELKKHYYDICNAMQPNELKQISYDPEHEKKRKDQLIKLYNRSTEQVEEEQRLLEELKKIELRKKEREKKTQDLQKLITAADTPQLKKQETASHHKASIGPGRPGGLGRGRKKTSSQAKTPSEAKGQFALNQLNQSNLLESTGIKFPEWRTAGVSLRSQRLKLPSAVGQKKAKAVEQLLNELKVDLRPVPSEEICQHFNELRSEMVLLYELKSALTNYEFELQSLKHQVEK